MSSSDDRTPQERLEENLKSPYPADGLVWSALIVAVAEEIAELEAARQSVLAAKFVSSAEGEQLDRLASIFELERQTGESNARFRIRLQTALRAQLSSATISDLRETVGVLLGGDASDVVVEEPESDQPLVDIGIWEDQLNDRGLTVDEFFDEVSPLTAAGVAAEGFVRGNFRFTAESQPVVSDRGFESLELAEGGGGTWPTIDQDGTFAFTDQSQPVESDDGFAELTPDDVGGTWPQLLR
ncbi:hypothetical protein SAMN05192561_11266 [Halopenitus malekzadehii]|uniref:Uncharacterized protein n=1 Tax=Halopenitus malekzadehii TaxID=1267564 RepID=A0A1H6JP31_9EURY|nr:hypothetical protein [Halopenitus malekzadehii]SEH61049.1 hypothetical protein SAMN05192561_11266 [Halopenitus malekzadehii]